MNQLKFILLTLLFTTVFSAIIGMDVGTQFTKTAFIGPKKIDIVENEESKRKDPTLIGVDKKHRRVFGSKAQKLSLTRPERIFMYSMKLIGKYFNDPMVEYVKEFLPCEIKPFNSSRTYTPPVFRVDNLTITPEEVTAMIIKRQLQNVKRQYQTSVNEGVLTISPSATPIERYSLVHAAKLAGLTPLSVVNSPVAFAATLAVNHDLFANATNVLFIDIGATSLDMGLFNFSSDSNTTGNIKAIGYYNHPHFGGHNFDKIIADIVMKKMENVTVKYQNLNADALYRQLLQKAEKAKIILSVNKEAEMTINLPGGDEWRTKITLETFETEAETIRKELDTIFDESLKQMGVEKDQIHMIQLLGGGMRVPMVLKTIYSYFGEEKINRNVDAEEGGAFGAAYYALMQGLGRMKKSYKIRDFVPIDWYITSPYLDKEIRLFSHKWSVDSQRTISFNKVKNVTEFNCTVKYQMMGTKEKVAYLILEGKDMPINQTLNEKGVDISVTFKLNTYGLVDIWKTEMKYTQWRNCTEKKFNIVNVTDEFEDDSDDEDDVKKTTNSTNVNGTETNTTSTTTEENKQEEVKEEKKEENKEEVKQEEKKEEVKEEKKEEEQPKEDEKKEENKEEVKEQPTETNSTNVNTTETNTTIEVNGTTINGTETNTTSTKKAKKPKKKVDWEEVKYECPKNESRKLEYVEYYHPLIATMEKQKRDSQKIIKYFEQIEENFRKLSETLNTFESTIYELRAELDENKKMKESEKEKHFAKLADFQEFLEFTDIDDMKLEELLEKMDQLKEIRFALHPELKEEEERKKKEEEEKKKKEEEEKEKKRKEKEKEEKKKKKEEEKRKKKEEKERKKREKEEAKRKKKEAKANKNKKVENEEVKEEEEKKEEPKEEVAEEKEEEIVDENSDNVEEDDDEKEKEEEQKEENEDKKEL